MILLKFPKNCVKSRQIWCLDGGKRTGGASPRSATGLYCGLLPLLLFTLNPYDGYLDLINCIKCK